MINQIFKSHALRLFQISALLFSTLFFSACQKENVTAELDNTGVDSRSKQPIEGTLYLEAKVFLDGPFDPFFVTMKNQLGAAGLIPGLDPDMQELFVDWVDIELRSATDPKDILETKSFLVKPDGTIANPDETTLLAFTQEPDNSYYVAVRHRNHLGCMTADAIMFIDGGTPPLIDFTSPATPTWTAPSTTQYPRKSVGGVMNLWMGDACANDNVNYQGPGNDRSCVVLAVLTAPGNTSGLMNYILTGYHNEDVDMDGNVIAQGQGQNAGGNDAGLIFYKTISVHPGNTMNLPNYIADEILP